MGRMQILLAEDDDSIAAAVNTVLEQEAFVVTHVSDGHKALEAGRKQGWDLILLDVMLPGMDGFEICQRLRAERVDVPILFLTARGEESNHVLGLGVGGDDYIVKPFSNATLVARVKAHVRRYRTQQSTSDSRVIRFADIEIDLAAKLVRRYGQEIVLTAREFALLVFLAQNHGRAFTKEEIFRQVWGDDFYDVNTVSVHIRRLREKIEPDPSAPRYVVMVGRGLGYRFVG